MDTGLSLSLEAVIAANPTWTIGQDRATGRWVATQKPTPTAVNVCTGRTLAELAAKLDAEGTAS